MSLRDDNSAQRFRVVEAEADIALSTGPDGLRSALILPTQSLNFRFVDGHFAGKGLVVIVDVPGWAALNAGDEAEATVTFPDAPDGVDFSARDFEVWHGRVLGRAHITAVRSDQRDG